MFFKFSVSNFFFVSIFAHMNRSKIPKIFFAILGKIIHFLNDFEVNLALIRAIGIPYFFAFKIKLGQISESTRNILFGFHEFKKLSIKKGTSKGQYLWKTLLNFFNSKSAIFPELKVEVVTKNFKFLWTWFNWLIIGIILLNSPMLAAWNQTNLKLLFSAVPKCDVKIFSLNLLGSSF